MFNSEQILLLNYELKKYFNDNSKYEVQNKRIILKDMLPLELIFDLNKIQKIDNVYSIFPDSPMLKKQGWRIAIKFDFGD